MSIDLFIMQPILVSGARGKFVEKVQSLAVNRYLDSQDVQYLRQEFPNNKEAVDVLQDALSRADDGMIEVSWG